MLRTINPMQPHEALELSRQAYVDLKYPNINKIDD
jgi:hypothetical protein